MRLFAALFALTACEADPALLPVSEAPPIAQCTAGIAAVTGGVGYTSVQGAINAATSPATVEVCPGTWYENLVLPAGTWTLTGLLSGGIRPTLDGSSTGRVINANNASDVTVQNLRLRHGYGSAGGGLYMEDGALLLSNCWFFENTAYSGGGLAALGVDVTIHSSEFTFNTSTDPETCSGGGAWFLASTDDNVAVSVDDTIFADNSAAEAGGGVCAQTMFNGIMDLDITASSVKYNEANVGAGLTLWSYGGTLASRADDVYFFSNDGGAAYMFTESGAGACNMDPDFINSTFKSNFNGDHPAITAYEFCGSLDVRVGYSEVLSNVATAPTTAAAGVYVGATLQVVDVDMGTGATDNVSQDFYSCAGSYGAGTTGMIRSGIGDWCP